MASYLYTVIVNKYNSTERMEVLHLIAGSLPEAINIATFHVYEEKRYPNTPVEIVTVTREMIVKEIINSFSDPIIQEDPFDLSQVDDESLIIKFKHSCSNIIEVIDNGWIEIECPDCKETILREDVEEVGGVWLYVGTSKNGKN